MSVSRFSSFRNSVIGVFCCCLLLLGGAMTPAPGADSKKKKSGSSKSTSTTKKKATASKGSKGKPKQASSGKSKSSTAEKKPAPAPESASAPNPSADTSSKEEKPPAPGENPPAKTETDSGPEQPQPPLPKADPPSESVAKPQFAPNVTLEPDDILAFDEQPEEVQRLIKSALALAGDGLTYTYGSADPANGGMDCSGAIYYLLSKQGFKDVPRDASGQYVWARKNGQFFAVISNKPDSFEFGDLLPGDLLFWNGTYSTDRDPPVTHSMIYLGVQRKRAQHLMWGSSDGRTYDGKPRWGVSVFDFKMPRADKNNAQRMKVDFLGYARIPGLRQNIADSAE